MTDITNTPDGDIKLDGGDLTYTDSTEQHQKDIILADKGYYKESPDTGVGAINFANDNNPENFMRTTRKECIKDGMKVNKVSMQNGKLLITAEYESSNNKT